MNTPTASGTGALLLLSCVVACAEPTNGLVAYFPLNDNALEATGTSSNGTLRGGATFADGIELRSLQISTEGDRVEVPNSAAISVTTNSKTISVWFYAEEPIASTGRGQILDKTASSEYQLEVQTVQNSQNLRFRALSDTNTIVLQTPIALFRWNHAVIRKETNTTSLYLNSVKVDTIDWPSPVPNTKRLMIGAGGTPYTSGYSFHGLIDEVRFYDRALTDGEITELFLWSMPQIEAKLNPFRVCWQSRIGKTYQLQARLDWVTNSWFDVGATLDGAGAPICLEDDISPSQKFYRLLISHR